MLARAAAIVYEQAEGRAFLTVRAPATNIHHVCLTTTLTDRKCAVSLHCLVMIFLATPNPHWLSAFRKTRYVEVVSSMIVA